MFWKWKLVGQRWDKQVACTPSERDQVTFAHTSEEVLSYRHNLDTG